MNKEEHDYIQACSSEIAFAAESYFVMHGYPEDDKILEASTKAIRALLGVKGYDSIQAVRVKSGQKPLSCTKEEFLEYL